MIGEWYEALVRPDSTIEESLRVLDRVGLKLVLVVDSDKRLLGVATDGDFRRGILDGVPIDRPIIDIMNSEPMTLAAGSGRGAALQMMSDLSINVLPVVNVQGQVEGAETLQDLVAPPKCETPVFIMAGGLGVRLQPLTEECPKPMLKVGGKPVLEILIEHCINFGFGKFILSTHYLPEVIREYFGDGHKLGAEIQYVHEDIPLGTAGALRLLPEDVTTPVLMMNGDILTKVDFSELLAHHVERKADITVAVRNYSVRIPYGVVWGDEEGISEIVEKPLQSYLISTGIYALNPDVIKSIGDGERIDMPDLVRRIMEKGGRICKFPIHEYWMDIGQMPDFQKAQIDYAERF